MHCQNNEEEIIRRCFREEFENNVYGHVIDIGAGDGQTFSNSRMLIENHWQGLLIEPSPHAFKKLLDLYAGLDRVRLLNAAVGVEERLVEFYEADDSLYSTTVPTKAKEGSRKYYVAQVTMEKVLEQLGGSAHVLSIDAEGASFDILASCPVTIWETRCIIVEHDDRAVEISGWGRARGYEVCSLNAENVVLFKEPKK